MDIIQSNAYISVKASNGTGAEAMTGERIEIELGAPPARVYEAIATADGVRSWWTDGTFAEEVGGIGRLSFGHGWTELRIERLVPEREVEWSCVGQDTTGVSPASAARRCAPRGGATTSASA
jgi:uncharacterized protein YndB with AHSA1/START domain